MSLGNGDSSFLQQLHAHVLMQREIPLLLLLHLESMVAKQSRTPQNLKKLGIYLHMIVIWQSFLLKTPSQNTLFLEYLVLRNCNKPVMLNKMYHSQHLNYNIKLRANLPDKYQTFLIWALPPYLRRATEHFYLKAKFGRSKTNLIFPNKPKIRPNFLLSTIPPASNKLPGPCMW